MRGVALGFGRPLISRILPVEAEPDPKGSFLLKSAGFAVSPCRDLRNGGRIGQSVASGQREGRRGWARPAAIASALASTGEAATSSGVAAGRAVWL
jgi:hypothetical protein